MLTSIKIFANSKFEQQALATISQLNSQFIEHQGYKNHYYSFVANQKEALVIVTGVAEPVIKYWQLFDAFKNEYDLYFWDHINQGASPDLLPELDPKKVYIDDFATYEKTLQNFLTTLKPRYSKLNVISHSMGGHITLKLINKFPGTIDKLATLTPMIAIKKMMIPDWLAKFVLKTFFKPTSWAPTQGDKNPSPTHFTSAPENFVNYQQLLFNHFPKLLSTGVTVQWLIKSFESIGQFNTLNFSKNKTPIFLITAGNDRIVKSNVSSDFCAKTPNCSEHLYKDAKHQILIEKDEIRLDSYQRMKDFFKKTL